MQNNNGKQNVQELNRKVAVIGYREVGKTSLATSFVRGGHFSPSYEPTIENTFRKTIEFKRVHFHTEVIDTAGMDEYSRLSPKASVGVNGYILVFSLTSSLSFQKLRFVHGTLLNMLGDPPDLPMVLVGSKCDLRDQRQVSYEEARALADEWNCPFLETSSRDNYNVEETFSTLIKVIEKDNELLNEQEEPPCTIL